MSPATPMNLGLKVWRYRPGQSMARHAHERAGVSIVVAGEVLEASDAREEHGRSGSIVVKPADLAHTNRFGPAGAIMVSVMAGTIWDDLLAASDWRWRHADGPAAPGLHMAHALADGDDDGWAEEALAALLAPSRDARPP